MRIASLTVERFGSFSTSFRKYGFNPLTNCQSIASSVTRLPSSSINLRKFVMYESKSFNCWKLEKLDSNFRYLSASVNYVSNSFFKSCHYNIPNYRVYGYAFEATYHHVSAAFSNKVTA